MPSPLTKQPMKALYIIFTIIKVIPYLAFLTIKFFPARLRQHSRYTHRQAIGVALLREWFNFASAIEFHFPLSLDPGEEKDRWVRLPPASDSLYIGELAGSAVKPTLTGGTWHPHLYDPDTDSEKRVILHLHGGAYVLIGARDGDLATGTQVLVNGMQSMVFFPQYRLSTYPNSEFPAPLQDAVTAYKYLLDRGISPSRIILSGDSAGGNLVIALLRFLNDHENHLPKPAAALLWSPWVDLAFKSEDVKHHRNMATDIVPLSIIEWGARVFCGEAPRDHPYLSPLKRPFRCPVPMLVTYGKAEILCDSITQFAESMMKIPGNHVQLIDLGDTPHDIMLTGVATGFTQEAIEGGRKALGFLEKLGL
ncbi:MAG: hypothetical protein Q9227_000097 [Pyrenula ochraceoflavens]